MRWPFRQIVLTLIIGWLIAGCGGGGSSSSQVYSLIYATDWALKANPNGGLSQRVTVTDANGMQIGQVILNSDSNGIQQSTFSQIPQGTVRLVAELFSGLNLSGTQTGITEISVELNQTKAIRTQVGTEPNRLAITPTSAVLTVPQNNRYTATSYSLDQVAFLPPGSLKWSVNGGIGSIDENGVFTSQTGGTGSIHAKAGSLSADSSLVVSPASTHLGKWTILVYMNAANDLNSFSNTNINQMEEAGSNSEVRVVVQWKQANVVSPNQTFNGTRRYLITGDNTTTIKSPVVQDLGTGIDMGSGQTLNDFIVWAKLYYPAERYALIIWNHGNGWRRSVSDLQVSRAFSYDDDTGNSIQIWQLGQALNGQHFDILAWDASLMQLLEIAYEARSYTDYVVGSEESPPGEGYPYDTILRHFTSTPTASSATLAKAFVDGMVNNSAYANSKITQSVIDTTKLDALVTASDSLSQTLIANQANIGAAIPTIRANTKMYSPRTSPPRYYLDLYDLCDQLKQGIGFTEVQNAAANVQLALTNAIVYERHSSLSSGSHGISIDFTPSAYFSSDASDYARMQFAQNTHWDEYLLMAP